MSATRNLAIVLEVGSRYTKCGFAGNRADSGHGAGPGNYDGAPRLIMAKSMPQLLQVDLSGATPKEELTPVVPKSPEEWKVLLRPHLEHVLFQQLLCNPTDRRVVIVEDLLAPKNFRQALAECLFDLKVGSVLFAPGAQLAVLTSGTRTGIVCDLGAEEVRVLPVFDGVPMLGAYTTSQLGRGGPTEQVHERIRKTLDPEKAPGVQGSMLEDAIARCCLVPPAHQEKVGQLEAELKTLGARSSAELKEWLEGRLELARKLAEVGGDEVGECTLAGVGLLSTEARCAPAGVFFEEDEEGDTLPSMIVSAVMKCPADVRRAILGNVVLAGGHAMIPGLSGRLVNALEQSMQQVPSLSGMRPALRLSRPGFNANTLSWVGGAIVGQDAEELESRSMSLQGYMDSRNTMQERSYEHIARASRDEVVQLTAEMGLEENEDEDIMKASLREAMREPEAALPDWTRMVPGSTAGAAWYFEKHDESEAREWTKRATRPSSWQRELDAGAGAGWMRLSDEAAAVLEAGLREHKDTVELELRQTGVPSRVEDSDEAVRVEYVVNLRDMVATRKEGAPTAERVRQPDEVDTEADKLKKFEVLLAEAQRRGLTSRSAVETMREHVQSGRYTVDHYLDTWEGVPYPDSAIGAAARAHIDKPRYKADAGLLPRNLENETQGDIPFVKTRAVRRMGGTEPVLHRGGYVNAYQMGAPPQPLPARE